MGAEIKRQIKTFNGVDYDKILAMLNDSVALRELNFTEFFGLKLTNDVVYNTDEQHVPMNSVYGGMSQVTDYARVTVLGQDSVGSGHCKILKTGYYLVVCAMTCSDPTTNTGFEIEAIGSASGGISLGSGTRAWDSRVKASCVGIAKLTAGEFLQLDIVRTYGGGQYRLESGRTSLRVYPLYIPD